MAIHDVMVSLLPIFFFKSWYFGRDQDVSTGVIVRHQVARQLLEAVRFSLFERNKKRTAHSALTRSSFFLPQSTSSTCKKRKFSTMRAPSSQKESDCHFRKFGSPCGFLSFLFLRRKWIADRGERLLPCADTLTWASPNEMAGLSSERLLDSLAQFKFFLQERERYFLYWSFSFTAIRRHNFLSHQKC